MPRKIRIPIKVTYTIKRRVQVTTRLVPVARPYLGQYSEQVSIGTCADCGLENATLDVNGRCEACR